jgi:hemerythrin
MPNRATWEPGHAVGHAVIDTQHQNLLAQCNRLADHCRPGGVEGGEPSVDPAFGHAFDESFDRLKAQVREHLETEVALLAELGYPDPEDHRIEAEEFDYLAGEIITTEHFDRVELQRFVTLWCIGHVTGSAARLRALLAGGNASAAAAS